MSIWKVIFATLVIFGAGVIAGVIGYGRFSQAALVPAVAPEATAPQSPINSWSHEVKPGPGTNSIARPGNKEFVPRLARQLNLDTDQTVRIEQVIADSQKRTKEISDGIAPLLREEVRHTRELIRAELTPEQARKYDDLMRPKKKKEEMPAKGFPRKVAKQEIDG